MTSTYTDFPDATTELSSLEEVSTIFTPLNSTLLIGISAIGCFTNICVLLTLASSRSLKVKSSWILVIHQSFADCVSSGVISVSYILIRVLHSHVEGWYRVVYCKLIWSEYLAIVGFSASALNMTALAAERFFMAVSPSIYHDASVVKIKLTMAGIWAVSIFMAIPVASTAGVDDNHFCHYGFFMGSMRLHQMYITLTNLITFYIPVFVMITCYSLIFKVVRYRKRKLHPETASHRSKLSKSHMNLIMTSALITSLFIVTWTPNQMYNTLYSAGFPLNYNDKWYPLSLIIVQLSSCLNPFIYIIKIKEIRLAVLKALSCVHRKSSVVDIAIVRRSIIDTNSNL